jgi:hypothetical protein
MRASNSGFRTGAEPGNPARFALGALGLLWQAVRLPTLSFLLILLPVVRLVLSTVSLVGVLTAFLFKAIALPDFHFWLVLCFSIGCMLLLLAYESLIRFCSR